jgi:hypothetical protein
LGGGNICFQIRIEKNKTSNKHKQKKSKNAKTIRKEWTKRKPSVNASNINYIFGVDVRACVLPIRKTVRATGVQQLSSEPLEGAKTIKNEWTKKKPSANASNTNYIFGVDVRACVPPIHKTVRATDVQQLSSEPLEGGETDSETIIRIVIDNETDESCTSIDIISPNWTGILTCVTLRFRDLELQVVKASMELKEGFVFHKFLVTDN